MNLRYLYDQLVRVVRVRGSQALVRFGDGIYGVASVADLSDVPSLPIMLRRQAD